MLRTVLAILGALVLALVLAGVASAVAQAVSHRSTVVRDFVRRSRLPFRVVLGVVGLWVALRLTASSQPWAADVFHALRVMFIFATAWFIGTLAFAAQDAAYAKYRIDVPDNRHARRVRTQVTLLRRLTVAILVVGALAAALLTFPEARAIGAGLLASASLLSLIAGLAAQSSLANMFAGIQLAFTDAIRVDDVVVIEEEWGRIEEITLTYVVVHIWDDRRLILPSTVFTTTAFENWTRRAADLLGVVELDVDWRTPVDDMRLALDRLLDATDLWDRRVGILQVTDATGGYVRVRAMASAIDAPTLWDLRCYVREGLVAWMQAEAPEALPRTRWEPAVVALEPPVAGPAAASPDSEPELQPEPEPVPVGDEDEVFAPPQREGEDQSRTVDERGVPVSEGGGATAAPTPTPTPAAAPAPAPAPAPSPATPAPVPSTPVPTAPVPVTPWGGTAGAAAQVRRRSAHAAVADARSDETQRIDLRNDARLFTGSIDAIDRSRAFSGPGADVMAERERVAGVDDLPQEDRPKDDRQATERGLPSGPTGGTDAESSEGSEG